ncbi:hypothetical protein P7G87_05315 [Enterococcus asini]|uniref:Uncharacterized protein n=1 Tax=Enterococcus asini ATCC 700915 TaxID=1158606 RepID=R2S4D9_9ENTE|nr:hypothetical protein [Enterococcus asini]EOH90385.1 hypothetical protein UAS_00110 [Enterococcus asini ATCC 700915]EOT56983.1 hypothetical protein I579_00489 [Enterococcus asini ATCC 700915]MCD5027851.1 hypothetical protein [Enterococcus asini]MDT2743681.1 hypothetical protein [Enterococcus asini]MDT2763664.1 hypothetical protein [Enterococcus asini]
MKFLFFFTLFFCAIAYLFYLLTRRSIKSVYAELEGTNKWLRKIRAVFKGIFQLIAY